MVELTKGAQQKGSDHMLWVMQLSSNLNSMGVSLPSVELANMLVSHICWENNVPITLKFLEKALILKIVPPHACSYLAFTKSHSKSTIPAGAPVNVMIVVARLGGKTAFVEKLASTNDKKSKKKKKKKSKEASSSSPAASNIKKPLDGILESISLDAPEKVASGKGCENLAKPCALSVLQVDPRYLNADNELRRIFGSKVVKSFKKHERSGGSSRLVRGGRRVAHIPRKTILITASEHWHRWDGSLSLVLDVIDGYHHFR
ncbi:hypothetical protein ACFX1Z_028956 [Malus domestica]